MSKKVTKRSKSRYPGLNPRLALPQRQDFVEGTEYVNGAKDRHGNVVIRPLTAEETAFLNKFNEETVNLEFQNDGTDLYQSKEDRRELYNEDYDRKFDLYNYAKRTGNLTSFNPEFYDDFVSTKVESVNFQTMMANQYDRQKLKFEHDKARKKLKLVPETVGKRRLVAKKLSVKSADDSTNNRKKRKST